MYPTDEQQPQQPPRRKHDPDGELRIGIPFALYLNDEPISEREYVLAEMVHRMQRCFEDILRVERLPVCARNQAQNGLAVARVDYNGRHPFCELINFIRSSNVEEMPLGLIDAAVSEDGGLLGLVVEDDVSRRTSAAD
jgi:hypothetical protein